MDDPDTEAWRIVRELRNEFVGRNRQPTDQDWAEFIAAGISRIGAMTMVIKEKSDDYEDGYQDALDDIEMSVSREKSDRRRRTHAEKQAESLRRNG